MGVGFERKIISHAIVNLTSTFSVTARNIRLYRRISSNYDCCLVTEKGEKLKCATANLRSNSYFLNFNSSLLTIISLLSLLKTVFINHL
jgi:hypothetical protein